MSGFTSQLKVEESPDGEHHTLLEPLSYVTEKGSTLTVPAGFVTDYASVPRILWNVLPPFGYYQRSAVLHDWLYTTGEINGKKITRNQADGLLLEAMKSQNVKWLTRWTIYLGVRSGGWVAWNAHRKQDK